MIFLAAEINKVTGIKCTAAHIAGESTSNGKIKPDNTIDGSINPALETTIALRCVLVSTDTMIPNAKEDNVNIVPVKKSKMIFPAIGTSSINTDISKIITILIIPTIR